MLDALIPRAFIISVMLTKDATMELYKFMAPNIAELFLSNLRIRFTSPVELNDPYEFRANIEDKVSDAKSVIDGIPTDVFLNDDIMGIASRLMARLSDRIGICCFTKNVDNILLWSHYAANHTGVAFAFDADHEFFKKYNCSNVVYTKDKPIVTGHELRATEFDYYDRRWPGWRYFLDKRADVFLTKSPAWQYEYEVRLIAELDYLDGEPGCDHAMPRFTPLALHLLDRQLINVPPEAVTKVILGPKHQVANHDFGLKYMSDDNFGLEQVLRFFIQSNEHLSHVKVLRAHANFSDYSLSFFDPLDEDIARCYLHPQEIKLYNLGMKGPIGDRDMKALTDAVQARK